MSKLSKSIEELIKELKKFPTIGDKAATRLAYFLAKQPKSDIKKFINSILVVKEHVKMCRICNNLVESDPCDICTDEKRDCSVLCVVESPMDLRAFERTKKFKGKYFVLHGVLSPYDGTTPEDLKIDRLTNLVKANDVKEVIVATNARARGEATAKYIKNQLAKLGLDVSVSRIAYGVPVGGELEYVDALSLVKSLEGRKEI